MQGANQIVLASRRKLGITQPQSEAFMATDLEKLDNDETNDTEPIAESAVESFVSVKQ